MLTSGRNMLDHQTLLTIGLTLATVFLSGCGNISGDILLIQGGGLYQAQPRRTGVELLADGITNWQVACSPNGTQIAYLQQRDQRQVIVLMDWETRNDTTLVDESNGDVWGLQWSPSGNQLGYIVQTGDDIEFKIIEPQGSTVEIELDWIENSEYLTYRWHPDGQHLLFSDGAIQVLEIATRQRNEITQGYDAIYLPGEQTILFEDFALGHLHDRGHGKAPAIGLITTDGKEQLLLGGFDLEGVLHGFSSAVWSPDGSQMLVMYEGTWPLHSTVQKLQLRRRDGTLAREIGQAYFGPGLLAPHLNEPNYGFSPDGKYVVYVGGIPERSTLTIVNLETGKEEIVDELVRDDTFWLEQIHSFVCWISEE